MSEDIDKSVQFNWFWYFIDIAKSAFLYNNSSFISAIGKRRSGKSVFTLGAACAVDPDFLEEQICFGLKELKEQLNEKTQTSIIWEEAGASAYARDFMDERNKLIVKTLQVYGYRKIALFGNFQHLKFLDGDVRLQLDCFLKMKAFNEVTPEGQPFTRTYAYPYAIITDWIQEPVIAPYKVKKDGVFMPIGSIPIPDMGEFFEVCGVSKNLYRNYLKKKDEYFTEIGEEETEEKDEMFSKRELKTITRMNKSFVSLASKLIDEGMPKSKVASLAEIPASTLNVWLMRSEEVDDWVSRVLDSSATT